MTLMGGTVMDNAIERPELQSLAGEINTEHAAVEASLRAGLAHALRAGELLIAAKELVEHGAWLPWLASNCKFSERTAQGYIRLYAHRAELEAKSATRCAFEDLSLRQGLKLLATDHDDDTDLCERLPKPDSRFIPPTDILLLGAHSNTGLEPGDQRVAWSQAVAESNGKQPTAAKVQEVVHVREIAAPNRSRPTGPTRSEVAAQQIRKYLPRLAKKERLILAPELRRLFEADRPVFEFLRSLRQEIDRRRMEAKARRIEKKWNPDTVHILELVELLDYIEEQLDKLGKC